MYCILYVLRFEGRKLPKEVVQERGVAGWLTMDQAKDGTGLEASFIAHADPEYTLTVHEAIVSKITPTGMMLHGYERTFSPIHRHRQAWWVVPRQGATSGP